MDDALFRPQSDLAYTLLSATNPNPNPRIWDGGGGHARSHNGSPISRSLMGNWHAFPIREHAFHSGTSHSHMENIHSLDTLTKILIWEHTFLGMCVLTWERDNRCFCIIGNCKYITVDFMCDILMYKNVMNNIVFHLTCNFFQLFYI